MNSIRKFILSRGEDSAMLGHRESLILRLYKYQQMTGLSIRDIMSEPVDWIYTAIEINDMMKEVEKSTDNIKRYV